MAKELKANGIEFDYEAHNFVLQDSFRYNGPYFAMTQGKNILTDKTGKVVLDIKYTPDFSSKILNGNTPIWFIETKGYVRDGGSFPLRWKMFLRHMSLKSPDTALFIPKNNSQVKEVAKLIKDIESQWNQ
jgi:hypothetical protein